MKPEYARSASDAIARTRHPRLDYRTQEARRRVEPWVPFLRTVVFPGCRALDLGCGAGKFAFALEKLGADAVGLDCSEEMIRLAQEIAADMGSAAKFVVGLFESLPFAARSFDLVWFPNNISECSYEEMDGIARQLVSILRPGGRFCIAMQDGMEGLNKGNRPDKAFDPLTGRRMTSIVITEDDKHPYEITFWTPAFARFVVSRRLRFDEMQTPVEGHCVLLFSRESNNPSPH